MRRVRSILLGPEAFWMIVCVAMYLLGAGNVPPTEAGSQALEKWWYLVPFFGIPAAFGSFLLQSGVGRVGLFIRVNVASVVGLLIAVQVVSSAIDYQDSRNAGVGMGYIMSIAFGVIMLFMCDIVAAGTLWFSQWRRARQSEARGV